MIDIGAPYPLVLTGGYAVQAHGLVQRLSQDLDVATENPAPMAQIVARLEQGLATRGWRVRVMDVDALSASGTAGTNSGSTTSATASPVRTGPTTRSSTPTASPKAGPPNFAPGPSTG